MEVDHNLTSINKDLSLHQLQTHLESRFKIRIKEYLKF